MKEMTGSGIFAGSGEDATENGNANPNKTGVRVYQGFVILFSFSPVRTNDTKGQIFPFLVTGTCSKLLMESARSLLVLKKVLAPRNLHLYQRLQSNKSRVAP